ncbi:MAG: extracellular solute-binding protein [Ruminococcaceae bacterium]|nr:extracellular solute-binding protein [Oscillospiraceae bacterium]
MLTNLNDQPVIKELRRRTGINVDILAIPSAAYKQKAQVIIASNESMPDIMSNAFDKGMRNDLGMQGAFVAVNKYADILPNFKKIFIDEAEERGTTLPMQASIAADGNLYYFPRYDFERDVNHGMLYRKDIFDKHGIKMWNSPEELYQALKKLKEIYPDSTPFVSKNGAGIVYKLIQSYGITDFGRLFFDENDGKWKQSVVDTRLKDLLDMLKKMYDEGLIDPEFITTTQSAWTQKMIQRDKAFVTFDWIGRLEQFKQQTVDTVPEYDLRFANPFGPNQSVITLGKTSEAGPYVTNNEKAEISLKLLDYLLSEGGSELMSLGVEGVTYNLDDKGFAEYVGFEGKVPSINEISEQHGLYVGTLVMRGNKRSCYFNYTELEKEAQDLMLSKENGFEPVDPALIYTDEEKEIIDKDLAAIEKGVQEFLTKYILAEKGSKNTGDAAWDAWVKKARTTWNIDEQEKVANEIYKRMYK